MSNIIDSIQLSGTVYQIQGSGGGGNPTVELTQAQYDVLVTAGTVQADTYYIITDAQGGDLSNYYTKTETNTLLNGKQATLVSGTNIKTINNESLLGSGNIDIQGGGKAVSGGTNISITTGETADTINCTLPISFGLRSTSLSFFGNNSANNDYTCAFGYGNKTLSTNSYAFGISNENRGNNTLSSGSFNKIQQNSNNSVAFGYFNRTSNEGEFVSGKFNVSNTGSTTAGNTLFSVGNGTSDSARHNAFEIRQNGDIYITSGGTDIKLQDNLGGGGGSITVDPTLDSGSTNAVANSAITTAIDAKADVSAVTAVADSLSGYVTTNNTQVITGTKSFVNSDKGIIFKQSSDTSKVGFKVANTASTNNEVASFEFRPNTFTIDNINHPLMYFGHYRNTSTANNGVPQTVIGFRQYDQKNAAAYHYLMPLPEKAKTPFSLTTSFKDYYAPMGFKNGSTMITADDTGVVDLSSELGGLKLVKLSQSEYDSLATKDNSTLYVIVN